LGKIEPCALITPYGGGKGFLHSFMKGVALEQAPYGIRANCVCPGPIDTAWTCGADSPIGQAEQLGIDAMGRIDLNQMRPSDRA